MFNINDIKNGITFLFEDNIYQVIEFLHVKPGKGAAFVKAKLKNLRTGSITEKTFNTKSIKIYYIFPFLSVSALLIKVCIMHRIAPLFSSIPNKLNAKRNKRTVPAMLLIPPL